jgi:hypothetical protein
MRLKIHFSLTFDALFKFIKKVHEAFKMNERMKYMKTQSFVVNNLFYTTVRLTGPRFNR